MPHNSPFGRTLRFTLAGAALAVPLLAATPAEAEIFPARQLARGLHISPAQCAALPYAVWITAGNRNFCIRYYVSTVGGQGDMPVVWLSGDKLGVVNMRTRTFKLDGDVKDIDSNDLQTQADRLSKLSGTTVIYLARPGIDGSSGHHAFRRSWLELYAVSAAMDAIRRRHGFRGFHVAGQSGGSGLIGGLMGIRRDLGCVVPGAGRLALLKTARPERDRYLEFFDASRAIPVIARNRNMRILVVTDPRDSNVQVQHQTSFVRALLAAGGQVNQFYVNATDEKHHGVATYTRFVVAACVRGKSNQEIVAGLTGMQERILARKANQQQRTAAGPTRQRREPRVAGAPTGRPGAPGYQTKSGAAQQPTRMAQPQQPGQPTYQTQQGPAHQPPQQGGNQQFTRPVPPPDSPYYQGPRRATSATPQQPG